MENFNYNENTVWSIKKETMLWSDEIISKGTFVDWRRDRDQNPVVTKKPGPFPRRLPKKEEEKSIERMIDDIQLLNLIKL